MKACARMPAFCFSSLRTSGKRWRFIRPAPRICRIQRQFKPASGSPIFGWESIAMRWRHSIKFCRPSPMPMQHAKRWALLYIEGSLSEARAILEARAGAPDADYYLDYLNALVLLRLRPAGDHSDALHWLDETLRKNPHFAPAYFERARIWTAQSKPEKALADLERAIATDPHYAQPYYLIAQVDYKLGKKKEADEARQRFNALNSEREEKEQERQVENQLLQALR